MDSGNSTPNTSPCVRSSLSSSSRQHAAVGGTPTRVTMTSNAMMTPRRSGRTSILAASRIQLASRVSNSAASTQGSGVPLQKASEARHEAMNGHQRMTDEGSAAAPLQLLMMGPALIGKQKNISERAALTLLTRVACLHSPLLGSSSALRCHGNTTTSDDDEHVTGATITTAYDLLHRGLDAHGVPRALSSLAAVTTCLPSLDAALLGGLRTGFITELTGPTANGCKSILAALWACEVVRQQNQPERYRSSCEQGTGSRKRERQADVEPTHGAVSGVTTSGVLWLHSSPTCETAARLSANLRACAASSLSSFFTAHVNDLESLQASLKAVEEVLIDGTKGKARIQLLVLDSFTVLVRRSFPGVDADTLARQQAIGGLLGELKALALRYEVAVLLLTESSPVATSASAAVTSETEEGKVGEFGRLFYHAVNVRLRLAEQCVSNGTFFYQLAVLKSPLCGHLRLAFDLHVCDGVKELSATYSKETAVSGVTEEAQDSIDVLDYLVPPTFVYV